MTTVDASQSILERRLARERKARKHAELLLSEKSSELYEALKTSRTSQEKLELALWASQESLWEWVAENDAFSVRSFTRRGAKPREWHGSAFEMLAHVHDDDKINLQFHWSMAVHSGRDSIEVAFRYRSLQGMQWMRMRGRVLERDENGTGIFIIGTTKDITQQRKAEQSFHLMASAFSSSREPMLVLSPELTITECNSAFLKMIGVQHREACIGDSLAKYLVDAQDSLQLIMQKPQLRFEAELSVQDEPAIPVDVSIAVFEAQLQTSAYLIATLRDISERQRNELRLRQLALHDDLTGLKNRWGLRESMTKELEEHAEFCVIFLDLDGFKQLNDAAGHEAGDAGLVRVAKILRDRFEPQGIVTRWGGDEFVVLVPHLTSEGCKHICEDLIVEIEADVVKVQHTELSLSASVGIARFPEHGNTTENLIQNADAAMYQAKTNGKRQVFIYQPGLTESMKERVSMVSELRRAITNRSLDFYLQGKYTVNGKLKSAELLCRWNSTLHGMVSPAVFIPLAEANNLDMDIGFLAVEAACDYLSLYTEHDIAITMAVNISANQLLDSTFAEKARDMCDQKNVPPHLLEIEITESIFMRDEKSALMALSRLRDKGFKIALDDFGSGFSSLGYLRSFEFEVVKIDQTLVRDIHINSKVRSLLQGIVSMLEGLQVDIVVEGVESVEYLPLLKEMNVTLLQGYLFDKPMPYEAFLLKHSRAG